jgi:2,3-bisphosphoglycerate-dependent phosphoglycerate mutase
LQGRHKDEILKKFGEKKFWLWRRSYNTRPPKITSTNPYYQSQFNTKFKDLRVPHSECLADVYKRVVPMWQKEIIPEIKAGKNILIVGHGNSMRALIKYLDKISDKKIADLNLPTGIPLVYELDKNFKPTRHYFLGDPKKVAAKIQNIIDQGHHDQI